MALDFDVDDGPSFQDLVQSGRRDVMKGRTMAQCWSELADQHPFFKDIAKEGRLRGAALGLVLAAVEGLSRVVRRVEGLTAAQDGTPGANTSAASPPAKSTAEENDLLNAEVLVRVADAYLTLYSTTPVPTRAQWLASLRVAVQAESAPSTDGTGADECVAAVQVSSPSPASSAPSSTVGRFVVKLRSTVVTVAQEVEGIGDDSDTEAAADGEDGSFAEEELKELMRCCMAAGRRAARHTALSKAEAKAVREMVKALQDFVGSSTLEW